MIDENGLETIIEEETSDPVIKEKLMKKVHHGYEIPAERVNQDVNLVESILEPTKYEISNEAGDWEKWRSDSTEGGEAEAH